jgi:hypothetical protein
MADSVPIDIPSSTAHKLATAKQKKDTGDQAFKLGNVKDGEFVPSFRRISTN